MLLNFTLHEAKLDVIPRGEVSVCNEAVWGENREKHGDR